MSTELHDSNRKALESLVPNAKLFDSNDLTCQSFNGNINADLNKDENKLHTQNCQSSTVSQSTNTDADIETSTGSSNQDLNSDLDKHSDSKEDDTTSRTIYALSDNVSKSEENRSYSSPRNNTTQKHVSRDQLLNTTRPSNSQQLPCVNTSTGNIVSQQSLTSYYSGNIVKPTNVVAKGRDVKMTRSDFTRDSMSAAPPARCKKSRFPCNCKPSVSESYWKDGKLHVTLNSPRVWPNERLDAQSQPQETKTHVKNTNTSRDVGISKPYESTKALPRSHVFKRRTRPFSPPDYDVICNRAKGPGFNTLLPKSVFRRIPFGRVPADTHRIQNTIPKAEDMFGHW